MADTLRTATIFEWVVWQTTAADPGRFIDTRAVKMSKRHLVEVGGDRTLCKRDVAEQLGRFGRRGRYAEFEGEPCKRCSSLFERITFHGRGRMAIADDATEDATKTPG